MRSDGRPERGRILIVDDEDDQRSGLSSLLSSWGYLIETAEDGQAALEKLSRFPAHVMVADLSMPRMDGFELLQRLASQGGGPVSIVLTAFGNMENALRTVHDLGAYWFLEKPVQANALRVLIERATAQGRLRDETELLRRQLRYQGLLEGVVGHSPPMQEVLSLVSQAAPSKAPVLITGESGTGKEVVARAIHNLSPRKNGPFVAINCAAMPETLMESELFGHEKGAFTGALQRRAGCFELANGGTLLLDEIGDMPQNTQAKLLRVLEDSKMRRLGGQTGIQTDVRVLAATNRKLDDALREKHLREDLYYRLNVFHLHLPPLRERMEDLPPIAEQLLQELNKKHECRVTGFHPEVVDRLRAYDWPGNVRELRNVLERAVIVAGEGTIRPAHLAGDWGRPAGTTAASEPDDPEVVRLRVGTTVREGEKAMILATLEHTGNNKTRAARILGVSLKTLHNKLKEYASE